MAGWTVRFVLWAVATILATSLATVAAADDMRMFVKRGTAYEDVQLDLQTAIEAKGLKIGAVGDLGDMLARTAKDLDIEAPVYQSAHYLQFCSAVFAHRLTAADPRNLGHCPFLMFIYETVAKPGEVVVGYRPFVRSGTTATRAVLTEVEAMLDAIAAEAVR
ncbi:MAG: DUF302 domain-containing protein [Hyphomicrobiaceae bacterium]